jgi:transglutaminase-like putative cysteine protease
VCFFHIEHVTLYKFSRTVFLEPHVLRLGPRADGAQRVHDFRLNVRPLPAGITHGSDAEGNHFTNVWFDGLHDQLAIEVSSEVETLRTNPFDFLLSAEDRSVPITYAASEELSLSACLRREVDAGTTDAVRQLATGIVAESEGLLMPFLTGLCQRLYEEFEIVRRESGDPWPASETLRKGTGACRDVALLFVDACRAVGLAARFVSGYQEGDSQQDQRDLHAWAEVYIPCAGWRGFDPTLGLTVADRHVAVAASAFAANAAAVTGSFRGTGATADISADIKLKVHSSRKANALQRPADEIV